MIRVHRREGGLEARGHEQVLEVLVAAVGQEIYDFRIVISCDLVFKH